MIVVDVLFPIALRRNLSYRLVEEDSAATTVGSFVRAPIGNRTLLGIVLAIHSSYDTSNLSKLKFITSIESHVAPISKMRMELWKWISDYYMCSLGEVMKAAMISGLPLRMLPEKKRHNHGNKQFPALSSQQTKAFEQISQHLLPQKVVLFKSMHGRFDIYIHLLQQALVSETSALLLQPEIGVSEQWFQQLRLLFGERAMLFHSGQTPAQRRNTLQNIMQPSNPIIVAGLRSSLLLLDLKKFGLIIVDEEHDMAYKQTDPAPRYHARDLAIVAGRLYQIPVVLGSSCASLESEYNTRTGKYMCVKMDESSYTLPQTKVVDTFRLSKKKQMEGMISHPLLHALTQSISQQKQALLFSRRCTLLQEQLQRLFPTARIARLDELHTPAALRILLQKFAQKEIDLLIGTQTIHKGLDFDNIGVIGILEADKQLSRPDFRAHERAYQIFTMLSCRMNSTPLVVLQTAQANHAFFSYFTHGDVNQFIIEQLQERKDFGYPPFTRLIALRFKHRSPEISLEAAQRFAQELAHIGITHISGPFASSYTSHLNTQFLWIHLPRHQESEEFKKKIYNKIINFKCTGGAIQVDVDPYL